MKQGCFYVIASDFKNIRPLIEEIISFIENSYNKLSESCEFEIKVILNELITNAIRHGNKSIETKKVKINADIVGDKVNISIADEGTGFNPTERLNIELSNKTSEEVLKLSETGRGLLIVKNLCDNVEFSKKGNAITVTKTLESHN